MASRKDLPIPTKKKSYIPFFDKQVYKLKVQEGMREVKKFNKEKKQLEPTGQKCPWKLQTFSISLGITGTTALGFIEVQYWGDKEIVEGKLIHKGYYYLKQVKWDKKNPITFVVEHHNKHILILEDFDYLEDKQDKPSIKYKKPEDPEKAGMEEYLADKYSLDVQIAASDSKEDKVQVNDFFETKDFEFEEEPKQELGEKIL